MCAACGAEGPLFREAPVDVLARELDVPVLARVPFDAQLAADADAGRPDRTAGAATRAFDALAERVVGGEAAEEKPC